MTEKYRLQNHLQPGSTDLKPGKNIQPLAPDESVVDLLKAAKCKTINQILNKRPETSKKSNIVDNSKTVVSLTKEKSKAKFGRNSAISVVKSSVKKDTWENDSRSLVNQEALTSTETPSSCKTVSVDEFESDSDEELEILSLNSPTASLTSASTIVTVKTVKSPLQDTDSKTCAVAKRYEAVDKCVQVNLTMSSMSPPASCASNDSCRISSRSDTVSRAQSYTWFLNTGSRMPMETIAESDTSLQDVLLDDIMFPGEIGKLRVERKNVRAKMNCCQLLVFDWKIWRKRNKNKTHDSVIFRKIIKNVEGGFGSGVVSFFLYARWLMILNALLATMWLILVIVPTAVYFDYSTINDTFLLTSLLDGQLALSESWMFVCSYTPTSGPYHTALAYLIAIILAYVIPIFAIIHRQVLYAVKQLCSNKLLDSGCLFSILSIHLISKRDDINHVIEIINPCVSEASRLEMPGISNDRYKFALLVWCGWDHSITDQTAVTNFSNTLTNIFKENFHEVKANVTTQQLTKRQKYSLVMKRVLAWIITFLLIGGGCSTIVYVIMFLNIESVVKKWTGDDQHFLSVYAIIIIFQAINTIVPLCINQLPKMEGYPSGRQEIHITVARIYILRLINLFALLVSLYNKVKEDDSSKCAGTVIGQEFYKLLILDTITHTGFNLTMKFAVYFWKKRKSEFRISKQVLDVVYRQALIWVGMLFCPVLPLIGAMSLLVFFFTNYVVVMFTCCPPMKRWNQSRHSAFFYYLLLQMCVILIIVMTFIIDSRGNLFFLDTSSDGPFRGKQPLSVLTNKLGSSVDLLVLFDWLTSAFVLIPVFLFMTVVITYQTLKIKRDKRQKRLYMSELGEELSENKRLIKRIKQLEWSGGS